MILNESQFSVKRVK